jgi:hypothetical protein
MGDLDEIYKSIVSGTEIFIMPVRLKESRLFVPSDDDKYAILEIDYFLIKEPLGLFASREKVEAWFEGARKVPAQDLPLEIHIPSNLVSEHGFIPLYRMHFLTEEEYAQKVAEVQKSGVSSYIKR